MTDLFEKNNLPDPDTPMVAHPAPINLQAESISLDTSDVENERFANSILVFKQDATISDRPIFQLFPDSKERLRAINCN